MVTTDNLIIAFPNSGKHWFKSNLNFLGVEIAETQQGTGHKEMLTYEEIISYMQLYEDKFKGFKIISLHRDPRDTIVSSYFNLVNRFNIPYTGGMPVFIRDPRNGVEKCIKFNLYMREKFIHDNISYLDYKELHNTPVESLKRITSSLGYNFTDDQIKTAYDESSFEKMRDRELIVNKKKLTRIDDPESFKVRVGKIGGYKDYLSESDIKYCNDLLEQYNYFERML
jgi:hypothetical protein